MKSAEMKPSTNQKKTSPLEPLDLASLHPLDERIISNQATQNLGTLGHVSHGKSTLVEAVTGIKTIKHEKELVRNITIKLGYANFKIFQCPECPKPECFQAGKSSSKPPQCPNYGCGEQMKLIRHFSFVDCPGHEVLMATMLNGAAVMDSALLIVAGNQPVPQPQTAEHLAAAEIMNLKNIICVQTKLDLVNEQIAVKNHEQIQQFVRGTVASRSPVIPVSCTPNNRYNVDVLLQYLVDTIPIPPRDFVSPPIMTIVRSFDVNRPGFEVGSLKGGVTGGTLKRGVIRLGQVVEMRPGLITREKNGTVRCTPLRTVINALFSEQNSMEFAVPGGLIAVGTTLDPTLTMADRLVGQVLGLPGKLPDVFQSVEITFQLMLRLVGMKGETKPEKIQKIAKDEILMINIGSTSTHGQIKAVKGKSAKVFLKKPCCAEIGEEISLSRNFNGSHRLIGCGKIVHVVPMPLDNGDHN